MSEFFLIDLAAITTILAMIAALLTGAIIFLISFRERPADARFDAAHRSVSSNKCSPDGRFRRDLKRSRVPVFEARRRRL